MMSKPIEFSSFYKLLKSAIDGNQSKIGVESTIVDLVDKPQVLRLGGIPKNQINKSLKLDLTYNKKAKIKSPGQGQIHYSPYINIRLNVKNSNKKEAFILIKKRNEKNKNHFYLSKNKNLKEAARNLYKTLRLIKKRNFKSIAVEKIPNSGFGEVINDRLRRASNFK